jgi:copper(I)-binding protein
MRKLDSVPVPVGTTEFKPGGLHLMLIQMKDGLKIGETHMVKLVFNEQTIEQPFLIKLR